ncbi:hemolysin family protein [Myxococcota bacterium]
MLTLVMAVGAALLFSSLCSVAEAVLLSISHAQVEQLGKSKAAKIFRRFKRDIEVPLTAILTLNTTAHTVGASVAGASYLRVFDESTLWVFSLVFTGAILLFTEIVPKTLGVAFVLRLAGPVAHGTNLLVLLLTPVVAAVRWLSTPIRRWRRPPVTSLEEIRLLAALGRTQGPVGTRMSEVIERAASLRDLKAYDVMVPRSGIRILSGERTLEQNLQMIRRTGHSRFPYAPFGDLDRIEGVVLVKDLLFQLHESSGNVDWQALLVPLVVVPATTPLDRLLRVFQQQRRHMGVVVDEYGGTQGIITLEDVLEELVGDIEDESDRINPTIIRRPDGSLVCRGWAETRRVFELLGIDQEVETVSLGGFVAALVERVPRVGDRVVFAGYELRVMQATARRAERIEIRRIPSESPGKRPSTVPPKASSTGSSRVTAAANRPSRTSDQ